MNCIAIIPARGGSKRLPRKNMLAIQGQPMLAYPIRKALKSNIFERVIVSTEDEEIGRVAIDCGAEVIHRPDDLAADRATVVQVCLHALDELAVEGNVPEYFCCIYATAIFLETDDIISSFDLFFKEPIPDVVMGVSEYRQHPVQAMCEKEGFLSLKWSEYHNVQSQFYPKLVASNGTLYWARTSQFREAKSFYCSRLKGYEIPFMKAIDIDTHEDFLLAQMVADKTNF